MQDRIPEIYVIKRNSHIKARAIKIKTIGQRHIEETVNVVNNGILTKLSSHARTSDGYQIFLQPDADGEFICQQILDALLRLPYEKVVVEKINC